jgi:hypothetical protein
MNVTLQNDSNYDKTDKNDNEDAMNFNTYNSNNYRDKNIDYGHQHSDDNCYDSHNNDYDHSEDNRYFSSHNGESVDNA